MKKVVNNRPIVFTAISFVVGMIIALYHQKLPFLFYILLGLIFAFTVTCYFVKKLNGVKILFSVLTIAFAIGFIYSSIFVNLYKADKKFDGIKDNVYGEVCDVTKYDSGDLVLTLDKVYLDNAKIYGKVRLYAENSEYKIGDKIEVYGTLKFNEYNNSNYSRSITFSLEADEIKIIGNKSNIFYTVSNYLKTNILNQVKHEEAGVTVALLLGDTSYINGETLDNYRLSGISHIFAVSGLHVVFFATMISTFLSICRLRGFKNTLITTFFTIFYAGLCGFPVSAVRAVIMTATLNFVKNAGKKYDQLNSLFLSLIVVLLIFPQTILSYGLILSYGAVLGINLFSKCFENLLSFMPEALSSTLSVSFAVSTFLTPLLFKMFGYSSLIVVFLNLIIVPIVSILYGLVFVTSLICAIMPFMGFLWNLPYYVAYFINSFLTLIDVQAFTVFGSVSSILLIIYFIGVFFACDKTNFSKRVKYISLSAISLILILAVGGIL